MIASRRLALRCAVGVATCLALPARAQVRASAIIQPAAATAEAFMARAFDAAEQTDDADPLNPVTVPRETLDDYGGYLQGLYGLPTGWAAGMRVDWVSGSGDNYDAGGEGEAGVACCHPVYLGRVVLDVAGSRAC